MPSRHSQIDGTSLAPLKSLLVIWRLKNAKHEPKEHSPSIESLNSIAAAPIDVFVMEDEEEDV